MEKNNSITVYTDGAASGNPGPGGYGVVLKYGKLRKEISEGFSHTTNNRMELMAVIRALQAIKWNNANVIVYTDSKYVSDPVNQGWLFNWEKKGFNKKKNEDLWLEFLESYRKHTVKLVWVKGHSNNAENNRCDRLAVDASKGKDLKTDKGYKPGED